MADNLYIGLYSAYQNKILAEKSLELANRLFEREEVRYNNGDWHSSGRAGSANPQRNARQPSYENIPDSLTALPGRLNYRYSWSGRLGLAITRF